MQHLSDTDAIRILTINKCKGLEFGHVIILGIENETFGANPTGQWPSSSSESYAQNTDSPSPGQSIQSARKDIADDETLFEQRRRHTRTMHSM